ncbi:hypothetical protein BDW59DRAFT_140980 [Aspergillus cavernicola]|uniref:NAD-dependent epimerase/dehydratase domain-containing protein n=1 Tax=Aspergillus cavernicola TaxID=176166 RepID=A0ABR4IRP3_9EURO
MSSAAVFGCTGAVGSEILAALLSLDAFPSVKTISRRLPKPQSPKLQAIQEADTSKWGGMISSLSPNPSVVFNAVGTTRNSPGGLKQQWKIDHDLCIENARAAKDAGVTTYVYISSGGTRSFLYGWVPYSKMKVGVEEAIKKMGFEHAIILRPGMIIGRETSKVAFLERFVEGLSKLGQGVQDKIGADQAIIGRAAVAAVRIAEEGKASKIWVVEHPEIIRLGRTEWQG